MASHEAIDGALLDVNIEGGRIDDVAAILARKHIPFIFVTGYGQDSLPAAHRRAVVIDKLFRDQDLIREVRRFGRRP
ncbi:hypothetical protein QM467_17060 [Rhodoblastus sp. 17X3]|uniref:hypothetical protein n=1 Tax=Rhodoblastus sp. 17X3 TaxID=3047026 RepID=UPI0024B6A5FC|nr:hypothetical protein [Rhodoblastus sp. 17X3]MDI9849757.1 hypothetical protein [Rhodoblastus sp. 17X3]